MEPDQGSQDTSIVNEEAFSVRTDAGREPVSAPNPPRPGRATRRQVLVQKGSRAVERMKTTAPVTVWSRLNAVEFMTSSTQFAALAILCLIPFLTLVAAVAGGDVRRTVITRLGLDQRAAQDVNELISPGNHVITTLSVLGVVFLILGAMGIASTLESWYRKVYDLPSPKAKARNYLNQLLWLGGLLLYLTLQVLVGRELSGVGARVPIYVVTFVVAVGFYWWTVHVLLLGRVVWGELFPTALATGICVTGLSAFSSLFFSNLIESSRQDYGSIGVVMILLSYLIGLGVCLHLGAVLGRFWNERHRRSSS